MSLRGAVLVGLVAVAACAGCATGTGSVGANSGAIGATEGQASPPGVGNDIQMCNGATYNRAADLCVSEGA
jgi:hypothetical protein